MLFLVVLLGVALLGVSGALVAARLRYRRDFAQLAVDLETDRPTDGDPHLGDRVRTLLRNRMAGDAATIAIGEREIARLLRAANAMDAGVVMVDNNGTVVFANAYASQFIDGRHADAFVRAKMNELVTAEILGERRDAEVLLYGPPRRVLALRTRSLERDMSGQRVGAVVLIDDVTEIQRVDAVRRDFVTNIGHELKTPIGAISLLAETMEGENDPEIIARFVERIGGEVGRLGETVDDLLEFSRIEHNERSKRKVVPLQRVLDKAMDRNRVGAKAKNVELILEPETTDLTLWANRKQLLSAVSNLIDNAVKYSYPDSAVQVSSREYKDQVIIAVTDTGPGIPGRDLDRIFERFYRVDESRERTVGGIGLGLAIVHHVAQNHGGEVTVDSHEGAGSTFMLTLPVNPPDVLPFSE